MTCENDKKHDEEQLCDDKCCLIKIRKYENEKPIFHRKGHEHKAGIFFYDPVREAVLLVQSRGRLWGCPKGSVNHKKYESKKQCAIREAKEETGIDVRYSELLNAPQVLVRGKALYYFVERSSDVAIEVQTQENNDANGITWIKIACLWKCIENGNMLLNHHCKVLFRILFGIIFPVCSFIKVVNKRRKKNGDHHHHHLTKKCIEVEENKGVNSCDTVAHSEQDIL